MVINNCTCPVCAHDSWLERQSHDQQAEEGGLINWAREYDEYEEEEEEEYYQDRDDDEDDENENAPEFIKLSDSDLIAMDKDLACPHEQLLFSCPLCKEAVENFYKERAEAVKNYYW